MFTGIVEEIATVLSLAEVKDLQLWDGSTGKGYILVIKSNIGFGDIYLGASISINGICLTVTEFNEQKLEISFGIAPETLHKTSILSYLDTSSFNKVNLERAAKMDSRNSGHYVQGHIDCVGKISKKSKEHDSLWIEIEVNKSFDCFLKYKADFDEITGNIVEKGFVAIDGTSLTVCSAKFQAPGVFLFTFMLVQHTQNHVIIPLKHDGDFVNIEVDVMGKYISSRMKSLHDKFAMYDAVVAKVEDLENQVRDLQSTLKKLQ